MKLQVQHTSLEIEQLATWFFNRSKTRALQSAGVFGLPVEKAKALIMAGIGTKKEAKYLFRMSAPSFTGVCTKITKKAKYLFWCLAPSFTGVSKKQGKKHTFFSFRLKEKNSKLQINSNYNTIYQKKEKKRIFLFPLR